MPDHRPLHVFISYSHADQYFHKRLTIHLTPLERDCVIEAWSDRRLTPGSHWEAKIAEAIERAEIAVLLISADFLASKFIREKELPPLLTKAKENGTDILPIIVGPSLFSKTPELSVFQAVNNPSQPLECITEGDQEKVLADVAEFIAEKSSEKRRLELSKLKSETFETPEVWPKLLRFGKWSQAGLDITGQGVGAFLLSEKEYGDKPFSIETTIRFTDFDKPKENPAVGMNAGIIFGWLAGYYNVLLTGSGVALERVGVSAETSRKSGHLTKIMPLDISSDKEVKLKLVVGSSQITLFVDKTPILGLARPDDVRGRVGLRAWRSKMACTHFEVREEDN